MGICWVYSQKVTRWHSAISCRVFDSRPWSGCLPRNHMRSEGNVSGCGLMYVAVATVFLMTTSSWAVGAPASSSPRPKIEKRTFGALEGGQGIDLYTLRNESGMEVSITN